MILVEVKRPYDENEFLERVRIHLPRLIATGEKLQINFGENGEMNSIFTWNKTPKEPRIIRDSSKTLLAIIDAYIPAHFREEELIEEIKRSNDLIIINPQEWNSILTNWPLIYIFASTLARLLLEQERKQGHTDAGAPFEVILNPCSERARFGRDPFIPKSDAELGPRLLMDCWERGPDLKKALQAIKLSLSE